MSRTPPVQHVAVKGQSFPERWPSGQQPTPFHSMGHVPMNYESLNVTVLPFSSPTLFFYKKHCLEHNGRVTVRRRLTTIHVVSCILHISNSPGTHSHMSRPLHNLVCCWRKEDIKSCLLRCMHGGTNSDIHFGVSHWSLHSERCKVLQDSQPPPLKPDMNSSPSENVDSGWVLTWVEVCR